LKNAGENAMPDHRKCPHDPSKKSIARWINEGGAIHDERGRQLRRLRFNV
jgi:hypothetical protein